MAGILDSKLPIGLVYGEEAECDADDADFLRLAEECLLMPMSAVLLSGGDPESGRYSIAAEEPFLCLRAKGRAVSIKTSLGELALEENPITVLDKLFEKLQPDFPLVTYPFSGGAVGYLAYELKNQIERLRRSPPPGPLPLLSRQDNSA